MDAATKADIDSHITQLKQAMEGTDTEAIKHQSEALMKASHKLAEVMYAKAGAAGAGPEAKAKKPEEEVVEAEFEEVK